VDKWLSFQMPNEYACSLIALQSVVVRTAFMLDHQVLPAALRPAVASTVVLVAVNL